MTNLYKWYNECMKTNFKRIVIIILIMALLGVVLYEYGIYRSKKQKFEAISAEVASYSQTTLSRINQAVVTLPEESSIVGLKEGKGSYTSAKFGGKGTITISSDMLATAFISGVYNKTQPRQDAIVPMYISRDSKGGSIYLMLFNDRGDTVIEKSFARLGSKSVEIESIQILPNDTDKKDQEYKVSVSYKIDGIDNTTGKAIRVKKGVIIPVVDGHFDPKGTVSK